MVEVGLCAGFKGEMGEVAVVGIVWDEAGLVVAQCV